MVCSSPEKLRRILNSDSFFNKICYEWKEKNNWRRNKLRKKGLNIKKEKRNTKKKETNVIPQRKSNEKEKQQENLEKKTKSK